MGSASEPLGDVPALEMGAADAVGIAFVSQKVLRIKSSGACGGICPLRWRACRPSAEAGGQQRERLVDSQKRRGGYVFGGDPLGEGGLDRPVGTRCRVHLVDSGETLGREAVGETHKSWPDSAVDQGDLSVDHARRDHVGRVENAGEYGEDLMT